MVECAVTHRSSSTDRLCAKTPCRPRRQLFRPGMGIVPSVRLPVRQCLDAFKDVPPVIWSPEKGAEVPDFATAFINLHLVTASSSAMPSGIGACCVIPPDPEKGPATDLR